MSVFNACSSEISPHGVVTATVRLSKNVLNFAGSCVALRPRDVACIPESVCRTASATGHHLGTIQTIVENVYVCLVGPRRLVSER